jgi:hypothetical protein
VSKLVLSWRITRIPRLRSKQVPRRWAGDGPTAIVSNGETDDEDGFMHYELTVVLDVFKLKDISLRYF